MLSEILFFSLTLIVIAVVAFLVYREMEKMKKRIVVEDETSRYEAEYLKASLSNNVKIIKHDMGIIKDNLNSAQTALSNNVVRGFNEVNSNYFSLQTVLNKMKTVVRTQLDGTAVVVADDMVLRSGGAMVFTDNSEYMLFQGVDPDNASAGLQIHSAWKEDNGFDLTTSNIATANLTVNKNLTFADANANYSLGIDGTSFFIRMPSTASSFNIKTSSNVTHAKFENTGKTSFYGDVSVASCIGGTESTSGKVCFNNGVVNVSQPVSVPNAGIKVGDYTITQVNDKLMFEHSKKGLIALDPTQPDPLIVFKSQTVPTTASTTTFAIPPTITTNQQPVAIAPTIATTTTQQQVTSEL